MGKIKANMDSSFEIKATEEGYVHVRTVVRVHIPAKKDYRDDVSIRKFHPKVHENNLKINFYDQYDEAVVIHDPSKGETEKQVKADQKDADTAKDQYKILHSENAPANMSLKKIKKAVADKEKEMLPEVEKDYEELFGEEAKEGLDIYEMIKAIEEKVAE